MYCCRHTIQTINHTAHRRVCVCVCVCVCVVRAHAQCAFWNVKPLSSCVLAGIALLGATVSQNKTI